VPKFGLVGHPTYKIYKSLPTISQMMVEQEVIEEGGGAVASRILKLPCLSTNKIKNLIQCRKELDGPDRKWGK
jgi:hypothetical protein